jgi:hypothetical protein
LIGEYDFLAFIPNKMAPFALFVFSALFSIIGQDWVAAEGCIQKKILRAHLCHRHNQQKLV